MSIKGKIALKPHAKGFRENNQKMVWGETEALLDYFGGGAGYYWIRFGEDWITTGLDALRPNWSYVINHQ